MRKLILLWLLTLVNIVPSVAQRVIGGGSNAAPGGPPPVQIENSPWKLRVDSLFKNVDPSCDPAGAKQC